VVTIPGDQAVDLTPAGSPTAAATEHFYIGDEPKVVADASKSGAQVLGASVQASLQQGLLVAPLPVPAGRGQGAPMTFGRFTVTPAPSSPERAEARALRADACEAGLADATAEASAEAAAAAPEDTGDIGPSRPPPPPVGPITSPRPSEASSQRVQRLGRFTVFPATNNDDETTDLDSSTTTDSASLCAERPDSFGVNMLDVHTFLEMKHKEIGVLFEKMRAQIFQVMVGQATGTFPQAAASGPGHLVQPVPLVLSATSSQAAQPARAPGAGRAAAVPRAPVSSSPSEVPPASVAAAAAAGAAATIVGPAISAGPGAMPEGIDEAINLWEALGKPIERATKRNRVLEDENKRLRRDIQLQEQELQELQRRAQAEGIHLASPTECIPTAQVGRSSSETSTGTSTPTGGSSGGTALPAGTSAAFAAARVGPGLVGVGQPSTLAATPSTDISPAMVGTASGSSLPSFGGAATEQAPPVALPGLLAEPLVSAAPYLGAAATSNCVTDSTVPLQPSSVEVDGTLRLAAISPAAVISAPGSPRAAVAASADAAGVTAVQACNPGAHPAPVATPFGVPSGGDVLAGVAASVGLSVASTSACRTSSVASSTASGMSSSVPTSSMPAASPAPLVMFPGQWPHSGTALGVSSSADTMTGMGSASSGPGSIVGSSGSCALPGGFSALPNSYGTCAGGAGAVPATGPERLPPQGVQCISMSPTEAALAAPAPAAASAGASRRVTGSPPRAAGDGSVAAEAALEGALRQAASSLVTGCGLGAGGIQPQGPVAQPQGDHELGKMHHSQSLPQLRHQLPQGPNRPNKLEGYSPDVQGYGPPETYRMWRMNYMASSARGPDDGDDSIGHPAGPGLVS